MIGIATRQNKRGFTLIEMLVYVAILITVVGASVALLISLDTVIKQYRVETALYRSSTNVLEPILLELRRGEQFDAVNSVIDDPSSGKLVVTNGATTTTFAKVGNTVELTINGVNRGSLLPDSVSVNGFTVYRYTTSIGTMVRVKVELSAVSGTVTRELDVYGGAVIRGDL